MRVDDDKNSLRNKLMRVVSPKTDEVLDALIELGFTAETVSTLEFVPLIFVAWADSPPTRKESAKIFSYGQEKGLSDLAMQHIENLLHFEPDEAYLRRSLRVFVRMCSAMAAADATRAKRNMIERAKEVAAASGGFLGFVGSKVSQEETEVIENVSKSLKITRSERTAAQDEPLITDAMTENDLAEILKGITNKG